MHTIFFAQVTEKNVEIVSIDYNTKLDIKESKRLNSGIYKIIATNEHGKDEAEVEIVVLGNIFIQKELKHLNSLLGRNHYNFLVVCTGRNSMQTNKWLTFGQR